MAETPESAVKRQIRSVLQHHYYQQPTTGGYGRSGQLDFTACICGHYLGIEAKSIHSQYGSKGPTALQWKEIDAIRASGGLAMSVDENNLEHFSAVVYALSRNMLEGAYRLAEASLARHERPELTVRDEPQPVVRKRDKLQEK